VKGQKKTNQHTKPVFAKNAKNPVERTPFLHKKKTQKPEEGSRKNMINHDDPQNKEHTDTKDKNEVILRG